MKTNFEKVAEFHRVFGHPVDKTKADLGTEELQGLRIALIKEELDELTDALVVKDPVAVADALTDILYVVYGAGHTFGIDLDRCFEEVHNSNMSKLGADGKPIYREDGKVQKGPDYAPPELEDIVLGVTG